MGLLWFVHLVIMEKRMELVDIVSSIMSPSLPNTLLIICNFNGKIIHSYFLAMKEDNPTPETEIPTTTFIFFSGEDSFLSDICEFSL